VRRKPNSRSQLSCFFFNQLSVLESVRQQNHADLRGLPWSWAFEHQSLLPPSRRWGHNRHFAAQAALAAPQREH
jgi:hypothetical protein